MYVCIMHTYACVCVCVCVCDHGCPTGTLSSGTLSSGTFSSPQ